MTELMVMPKCLNIRTITPSLVVLAMFLLMESASGVVPDPMQSKIEVYFGKHVKLLADAAQQQPDKKTFRKIMKPLVKELSEFREATILSTNFVIQLTYYRRHVAAVGYDLKGMDSLKKFHEMMLESPNPQISGPTTANFMRPSLITLRYPILHDEKLVRIISLIISTDDFLEKVGLADCNAYRISCSDGIEVSNGQLSTDCQKIEVELPSAKWSVEYDSQKD